MKYCHGLKDDDLISKIFELGAQPGWEQAKQVIRIYTAASCLKEGLDKKKKNSKGQVLHAITGSQSNSNASSPGERRKAGSQGERRERGRSQNRRDGGLRDESRGSIGSSRPRECWNCLKMMTGDHYNNACPEPRREGGGDRRVGNTLKV